jgi:methylmalonyl-CoA/ethylmalonyl-CoA epimerase
MFTGIHHTALVVRSLDASVQFYRDLVGLALGRCETVQDQGVRAALFPLQHGEIELLEPVNPAGGVAKFLEKRGEGPHHFCVATTDVEADLAAAKAAGVPVIDQTPRQGLAGRIAFLHPSASQGVLVELAEPGDGAPHRPLPNALGALGLERLYLGVKDPAAAADTCARTFQAQPRGSVADPVGLRAAVAQLGPTALCFLSAADVGGSVFLGRPEGLIGAVLSVADLAAAGRHLRSTGAPFRAVGTGPQAPLLHLDPERSSGLNLFLVQAGGQ